MSKLRTYKLVSFACTITRCNKRRFKKRLNLIKSPNHPEPLHWLVTINCFKLHRSSSNANVGRSVCIHLFFFTITWSIFSSIGALVIQMSVCLSVCLSVSVVFFCHNLVNFDARNSRFCMELDLDNS